MRAAYDAFDRYQREHAWLGFPLAVRQKYSDDQGGYLAATITYYVFFAVFPLLLVFTTGLGFVLASHPHLYGSIVDTALAQFPVIGRDLRTGELHGNALALGLGIAASLWAGMGAVLAAQNAMNHLWGVPYRRRPDFFHARGRALLVMGLLGGAVLAATVLAGLASLGTGFGTPWKAGSVLLSTAVNFGLFWVAFRLLTAADVSWRNLRNGALAAAVLHEGLQALGAVYIDRVVKHAGNTYGTFALVIGLLSWIYLGAHITLLAAEANVVGTRRLWPRSFSVFVEQPATEADRRALALLSAVERRRSDQEIDIRFQPPDR